MTQPIRWDGGLATGDQHRSRPPTAGDEPATLLRNADREMFANKRQRKLHLIPESQRQATGS